MATAPAIDHDQSASNSIAVIVAQTPAVVLTDDQQRDKLFAHIQREIDAFTPDLSTAKGRDAIKSFAFKITRTKTAIDDAGKKLNEDARARINVVDAARKVAREKLEEMAKGVRKPLTDWEEAEKARVAAIDGMIAQLKAHARVDSLDTAAMVRERGTQVWNITLDPDVFQDRLAEVQQIKAEAVDALNNALARLTKEEADRAELERLRAAEAERLAKEQAEREEREAAERAQAEARAAEERRVAAEKAEQERLARVQQEAEERAKREAEAAAEAERLRIQREHEEALAAERRRAEEAERAAQAERDRIAKEDADRQAEADRIAAEQARREADQAHRTSVKTAAKQALMTCGADEETARKIVVAILAGEVPNVTLRF